MSYVIAVLIAVFAGWSVAACDALFRAEVRPGIFNGTAGTVLLLAVAGAGGLILAGAVVWVLRIVPSAVVATLMAIVAWGGGYVSNRLNATAAGAANRMMVGLAGLVLLYALAWTFFPVP